MLYRQVEALELVARELRRTGRVGRGDSPPIPRPALRYQDGTARVLDPPRLDAGPGGLARVPGRAPKGGQGRTSNRAPASGVVAQGVVNLGCSCVELRPDTGARNAELARP